MSVLYYIANIKDVNLKNNFLTLHKKNKDINIINDEYLLYRIIGHKSVSCDDNTYACTYENIRDLIWGFCCIFDDDDIDDMLEKCTIGDNHEALPDDLKETIRPILLASDAIDEDFNENDEDFDDDDDDDDDDEFGDIDDLEDRLFRDAVSERLIKLKDMIILKEYNGKFSIVNKGIIEKNGLYLELLSGQYDIENLMIMDSNNIPFENYVQVTSDFKDVNYQLKFDDLINKCLGKFKKAIISFEDGDIWQVEKNKSKLKYGVSKEDNKVFSETLKEYYISELGFTVRVLATDDTSTKNHKDDIYVEVYGFYMSYDVKTDLSNIVNINNKDLLKMFSSNDNTTQNQNLIYCDLEGNRFMPN